MARFDSGADRQDGRFAAPIVLGQFAAGRLTDQVDGGVTLISLVTDPVVACDPRL